MPCETSAYDWSNVRKHLFSLQAMYIFAGKQHFFALDPDIVIRIDKLIQQADENVVTANSLRAANAHQE